MPLYSYPMDVQKNKPGSWIVPVLGLAALLVFSFFLYLLAGLGSPDCQELIAREGQVMLPGAENPHGPWILEGEWNFFPGVLLEPGKAPPAGSAMTTIKVPSPSKPFIHSLSQGLPDQLCTYRLRIFGLQPDTEYGIFIKEVASAYRIYADGKPVMEEGRVSEDATQYVPRIFPRTGTFHSSGTSCEILIQVADFESANGGLWQKVYLGTSATAIGLHMGFAARDLFFLSSLIMLAAYQWILFFIMRRDRATLFLALFSTSIVVKSLFAEMMFGVMLFPWLPYPAGMFLAYAMIIAMPPLFLAYMRYCFPDEYWKPGMIASLVLAAGGIVMILVTPFAIYQAGFVWYQVVILGFIILGLVQGGRAVMHRRQGSLVFMAGFAAVIFTAVNDILFSNHMVQTGFLLNVGLYLFLLAQAATTAIRYRSILLRMEDLSRDLEAKVALRTRELEQERNTYERLAKEDSLTGLYNKRHLNEVLETEFHAFKRYGHQFSVLMIDLDWFKQVNDTRGHLTGDQALIQMSQLMKKHIRKTDICGRFGGEEFLLVMRYTSLQDAGTAAEHLRQTVENTAFATDGGSLHLTVSIGVSTVSQEAPDASWVVSQADAALYQAKASGRNCIRIK